MSYVLLAPEIILAVLALAVILTGLLISEKSKNMLGYISAAGLAVSLILAIVIKGEGSFFFYNALVIDPLSQIFKMIFLAVSLLAVIASIHYFRDNRNQDEYYALILLATVGMMVVASANDLLSLFVGFELASMSTYVLAGFEKKNPSSLEAGLKYFIIGSLSSALMLFGMSLVYGITGSTNIPAIMAYYSRIPAIISLDMIAMVFLIAGFGFKMALVPFHMWAPDTYEGAPTVVSSLLAAGSKKMGFVAAFRVLVLALVAIRLDLHAAFAILAIITMTYGNVVAISQRSIKRMLAYSSIAQAGYISLAFVVTTQMSIAGGVLLALGHALMKGGAFIAVAVVGYMVLSDNKDAKNTDDLEHFAGLGKRAPITAFSLLVFFLALAGIPPSAGFVGKFVLFYSVTVEAVRAASGWLLLVVIIAILNSALSIYYYARVIKYMYVLPPAGERINEPLPYVVAIVLAVIGTLGIGLFPEPFIRMAMAAANVLGV